MNHIAKLRLQKANRESAEKVAVERGLKSHQVNYNMNGLTAEEYVIKTYKDLVKSSEGDDIHNDIDAYSEKLGNISIKSVEEKFTNFALETHRVCDEDRRIKRDSWFTKGKSDWYFVARFNKSGKPNGEVWKIKSSELKEYVAKATHLRKVESRAVKNHARKYNLALVTLISWKEVASLPSTVVPKGWSHAKEMARASLLRSK